MKAPIRNSAGFTLIELLVVIAIIGLLSSVVLASVSAARAKAKDAAIKAEVAEMANLMELNYDEYGSYCNFQYVGWITDAAPSCVTTAAAPYYQLFLGDYAPQAQAICANLFKNAGGSSPGPGAGYKIFMGINSPTLSCANTWSVMVSTNDGGWYCAGSSGARGRYNYYGDPWAPPTQPGCWANP